MAAVVVSLEGVSMTFKGYRAATCALKAHQVNRDDVFNVS